jgi:hypothetical protein
MDDTLRVAADASMPKGRCVVLNEGAADLITYVGRIGKLPFKIATAEGAVVVLNPADFVSLKAYLRKRLH